MYDSVVISHLGLGKFRKLRTMLAWVVKTLHACAWADLNLVDRGFTTLSATLGKLALSLHDGLLQDAASEAHPAALTAVLRALHVLISSAPYARLPPTLLPRTLTV